MSTTDNYGESVQHAQGSVIKKKTEYSEQTKAMYILKKIVTIDSGGANRYLRNLAYLWFCGKGNENVGSLSFGKKVEVSKENKFEYTINYFLSEQSREDYKSLQNASYMFGTDEKIGKEVLQNAVNNVSAMMESYIIILLKNYSFLKENVMVEGEEFYQRLLLLYRKDVEKICFKSDEVDKICKNFYEEDNVLYRKFKEEEVQIDILYFFFYRLFCNNQRYDTDCARAYKSLSPDFSLRYDVDIEEEEMKQKLEQKRSLVERSNEKKILKELAQMEILEETVFEEGMEKESIYNLTKKVQSVPQEERDEQIKTMEALEEFLAAYKDILAGNASYGEMKNLEEGKERLQENIEKGQSFLSEWLMG